MSSIPWPSRRNSGFHATGADTPAGTSSATRAASLAAVPTGTVDLPTTRQSRRTADASASTTESTALRSAAAPLAACGVPTHTKWTSACSAASRMSVVNRSRPVATCLLSSSRQAGFGERRDALPEERDLVDVAVDADDRVSELGHACRVRRSEVARADDADP